MNAVSDIPNQAGDGPDLDALLAPLAPDAPCGPPIRHDPVFTEIRLLREEDDPALPMGQWERPLKCADWPRIEHLCSAMLAARSKDLQLASWLAESWTRQRGVAGLADGLRLVDALLRRYWSTLHPVVGDDGDSEARLAPLEWLNRSLSDCVRLHASLFTVEADKPVPVTLTLWERLTALDMTADSQGGPAVPGAAEQPLTRADIHACLEQLQGALAQSAAAVEDCLDAQRSIAAFLHDRLGDEAPKLGRLEGTLEAAMRVLAQLRPGRPAASGNHGREAGGGHDGTGSGPGIGPNPADTNGAVMENAPPQAVELARWRNRSEAYMTLAALADYLSEVEPHSPTPFLIRRAANWGRMSLPEVIAEIIREEGDLGRFFQVLGIKS
jgi:type VI secretion system protein ImpA